MKKIDETKMDNIKGGNNYVSGPIISAITSIINILRDAGYALGSGIRRISEDNLCPLE